MTSPWLSMLFDLANAVLAALFLATILLWLFARTWVVSKVQTVLSAAVGRELAEQKYRFDRELEAYKTSLIRDLEQLRADIDVRRAIALQRASIKLNALSALFASVSHYLTAHLAMATLEEEATRKLAATGLLEVMTKYQATFSAAEIFIPKEVERLISSLASDLAKFAQPYRTGPAYAKADDPRIAEFARRGAQIDKLLREFVEGM